MLALVRQYAVGQQIDLAVADQEIVLHYVLALLNAEGLIGARPDTTATGPLLFKGGTAQIAKRSAVPCANASPFSRDPTPTSRRSLTTKPHTARSNLSTASARGHESTPRRYPDSSVTAHDPADECPAHVGVGAHEGARRPACVVVDEPVVVGGSRSAVCDRVSSPLDVCVDVIGFTADSDSLVEHRERLLPRDAEG
jgi:hypothetical protein